MKGLLILFTGILLLFSFACSHSKKSANKDTVQDSSKLQSTYWKLYSLMGETISSDSIRNREPHIVFDKNGRASGNAGCNQFTGSYQVSGKSQIAFGPMISTKMYCDDIKYESLFLDLLSKADNFLITGDTLSLRNKQMDSTAIFISEPGKMK